MIIEHIKRLRSFPVYAKSKCVLLVEIGADWLEAGRVADVILNWGEAQYDELKYGENPMRRRYTTLCPGVIKSSRNSANDMGELGPWLCIAAPVKSKEAKMSNNDFVDYAPGYHCGDRCLFEGTELLREVLSVNSLLVASDDCSANPTESFKTLCHQLEKFRLDVKPALDPVHGKTHIKPTGKAAGQQDDQVRNIQNVMFQVKKVLLARNHSFAALVHQNHWRLG